MTHTEVLVIGAGPAGIAAATAAAENGCTVIVLDDNLAAGGQIWRGTTIEKSGSSQRGNPQKRRAMERLRRSGAELLGGRCVFNVEASGMLQTLQETGVEDVRDPREECEFLPAPCAMGTTNLLRRCGRT